MTRLGDTACRTLAAVLTLHARNGRVTVRDVAKVIGRQKSATHRALGQLKAAGLIDWEPYKKGTLQPACDVVRLCVHVAVSQDEQRSEQSATLGAQELSGRGAAETAPGLADTPGGADMAGLYPGTPDHAQGRR